jgi:pimeloyl-ACP methyl ester carboxylesterase
VTVTAATLLGGYAAWRYRRSVSTAWGRVSYRHIERESEAPTLVLIHGWGRTADSAWWPVFQRSRHSIVAVDLPGHGRSVVERPFSFSLAAEAVTRAVEDAGLDRPVLVGHSMGGPVALTTLLWTGPDAFAGLVGMASSAYWVAPRQMVVLAAGPVVMGPRSPVTVRRHRREARRDPTRAGHIAWEWAIRPERQVLVEAAMELRRFDARRWSGLHVPPTTWVITADDGIVDPDHQRASALFLGATAVELPFEHSLVVEHPEPVTRLLDSIAEQPGDPTPLAV